MIKIYKTLFIHLFISSLLFSNIIYETGSLKEFIAGECPTCAYDNFINHTSEGIAQEGYNIYAPDWIDVQNNGFGNYRIISQNSESINHWKNIFSSFIQNDFETTTQLLSDSLETFNYNLIEFTDTSLNRTYFMLRENLDYSYYDSNRVEIDTDDIEGSFKNGWGLYIINPNAENQQVIVEVPHPNDDFISPYISLELFLQIDAFSLMIAGAGREVKWTEEGDYNNNKSLSDPSRNANTPFNIFHEILCDSLIQLGPHSPIVFHMHSFDENIAHEGFNSVIMSGGYDAEYANKPIRDISSEHKDLINFTDELIFTENHFSDLSFHPNFFVNDYYQVHYDSLFYYYGDSTYEIDHAYELLGPYNAVQMEYLRNYFNNTSVYEPWIQIELDELPELFHQMDINSELIYTEQYPVSYNNYEHFIDYYYPFMTSVKRYLDDWNNNTDNQPPNIIENFRVDFNGEHYIDLEWDITDDSNFKEYKIFYDTDSINENSLVWDANNSNNLSDIRTSYTTIYELNPDETYSFAIQAYDHFDNQSFLSNIISDSIIGHTENIYIIENFELDTISLTSFPNHDEDSDSWQLDTINTFYNSNNSLKLFGNTWKTQDIEDIQITNNSIWQISSYAEETGEIIGLAIQDSVNTLFYSFYGSQELDIEEWVTVYQGAFPENQWNIFQLPIADDWFAYFDYLPLIEKVTYINDKDNSQIESISYFDDLIDITSSIEFSPNVEISYQINQENRTMEVMFNSTINDPDSYIFDYLWSFGDGNTSTESNPTHIYNIQDNHAYNILLQVIDESGNIGYQSALIDINTGESSLPITLNFVGDIMFGRTYDNSGGIIDNLGVEALFEPTKEFLGDAADITIANLECPLTNDGPPHPTKSVVFKARPENVNGLTYAGIDIVSLANNHTLDYGLEGLVNTQNILDEHNILYSGGGENSIEAYEPLMINTNGLNLALLASSDRTGQYNNYQPYLNAGYNKPGFAYMTPYYIQNQIQHISDISDFVILELHAGSEYSYGPSENYDNIILENIETQNFLLPEQVTEYIDIPDISDEEENYNLFLDVPHMWDREIRHFAIDNGADMVIVHHPHIIQGLEIYNSKLIAHSLGNFIFDLSYPETFPSMILESKLDTSGFYDYKIIPAYIDDYITNKPTGGLALHILDYIAQKSKELNTTIFVDRLNLTGHVIIDSLDVIETKVINKKPISFFLNENSWHSIPIPIHENGNFINIDSLSTDFEYRVGKELIWFGNMEDEGCSLWNLNSNDEYFDETVKLNGQRSLYHQRTSSSGDNIVTNFEKRLRINDYKDYGLYGNIKSENANNCNIEVKYYTSRTTSISLGTDDLGNNINGNNDWTSLYNDLDVRNNANFFDLRLYTDVPNEDTSKVWYDDISVIEWSDWYNSTDSDSIFTPNDYYFIQIKSSSEPNISELIYSEMNHSSLESVNPDFNIEQNVFSAPSIVNFSNESSGYTGWYYWDFGNGETSFEKNPTTTYLENGIYTVALTVLDYNGNPITNIKEDFIILNESFIYGDLNFDASLDILDIVIMVNLILDNLDNPSQTLYEYADLDNNNSVDIIDIVLLVNGILD